MAEHEPKHASTDPAEDEGYPDEPVALPDQASVPAPKAAPAPEVEAPPEPPAEMPASGVSHDPGASALEERMRRIEDALAVLVSKQTAEKDSDSAELIKETRKILPIAKKALRAKDRAEKAVRAAAAATSDERWVMVEAFAELRDIFTMYVDRRYEVSWACWLVPAGAVVTMVLFYFTLGAIPIFGGILDKLADLFVFFIVYKILRRESVLYREAVAAAEQEEASA